MLVPFDHPEGSANVGVAHPPEEELKRMGLNKPGPDFERSYEGKFGKSIAWKSLSEDAEASLDPTTEAFQFEDFVGADYASTTDWSNSAAYLYRAVQSDSDLVQELRLATDDGFRVWLNGSLVKEISGPRELKQKGRLELPLQEGTNHLLIKVVNGAGAWGFSLERKTEFTPKVRQAMQREINSAIDLGVDYLLKSQQVDGSWGYDQANYRNGQTALSIYALLESGVKEQHQAIQRALAYLELEEPKKTYSNAVQILALAATRNEKHKGWIEDLIDLMRDWQDGDFAYPTGHNDLSCSQYGAFAYWIASQRGVDVPKKAWIELAKATVKYENDDGGMAYRPRGESTGSMTVAGLTVLSLCEQALGKDGVPRQVRKDFARIKEGALRWLIDNFEVESNPAVTDGKRQRWAYYYLYGIERLAALLEVDRFGEHEWYWLGAEHLLAAQGEDGAWTTVNGEAETNTSFALLFLNRATATASGPGVSRKQGRQYATDDPESLVVMRAKGDTPLNIWLSEVRPQVLETHGQEGPAGSGLYLEAIEYKADGEVIAKVETDSSKPWTSEPYATQHIFKERGDHEIQMVLHFAKLEGQEELAPVESPVIKVRIDERLEPWMLDYVNDRSSNLALGAKKELTASSKYGEASNNTHNAGKAFDGLPGTSWISNKEDPAPELRADFKKSVRVDRILLSHAANTEVHWGDWDRAKLIAIDFGRKGEVHTVEIDPESRRKHVFELPKATKISKLRIRILERETGSTHPGCVGFSEIELRYGEEKKRKR